MGEYKNATIYRASPWRRFGYPLGLLAPGSAAVIRGIIEQDPFSIRFGILLAGIAVFIVGYVWYIRLKINAEGISLSWPMQGEMSMKWDAVVLVRRAEIVSPTHFFIELSSASGHTIRFNPYFFERPDDIIDSLNKSLDSDLFRETDIPAEGPVGDLVATAQADHAIHRMGTLAVIAILAVVIFLLYRFISQ
jgi:hypothetical protein